MYKARTSKVREKKNGGEIPVTVFACSGETPVASGEERRRRERRRRERRRNEKRRWSGGLRSAAADERGD
ncbi:hypothetical protein L484_014624 [Morus notabilis]|uniref:Uncharacterized protein n=1 Tax=Morus notabilis TaxID=981085 RepID=W9R935_9ROSA|nr:hypothetical protein L484_014624 [Morus notabilis]